jgi:hypothetical protein
VTKNPLAAINTLITAKPMQVGDATARVAAGQSAGQAQTTRARQASRSRRDAIFLAIVMDYHGQTDPNRRQPSRTGSGPAQAGTVTAAPDGGTKPVGIEGGHATDPLAVARARG